MEIYKDFFEICLVLSNEIRWKNFFCLIPNFNEHVYRNLLQCIISYCLYEEIIYWLAWVANSRWKKGRGGRWGFSTSFCFCFFPSSFPVSPWGSIAMQLCMVLWFVFTTLYLYILNSGSPFHITHTLELSFQWVRISPSRV